MKKRADGRYRAKVTLPSGQVKYVYGYSQKEVKENKEQLLLQYALGATNIDRKITVQDWAEKWWTVAKEGKTGVQSQYGYISAMNNYIFDFMGSMKLVDVKPIHVQQLLNKMGQEGRSKSLQHKVLITLNAMFIYAMRNGLIVRNPAQFAELYEVPIKIREALTPDQTEILLEKCKGLRAELAIHLALYCGLRRGEIAALKWSDINEEYKVLIITNAVEYVRNRPKEKGPKTVSGIRIVPIPPELWDMLQRTPKKSLYVVPSAKGLQMTESSVRRMMEPVQRRIDKLEQGNFKVTLHMLRHTYATNLDKLGVSPKACQYLLGHADYRTSKNIYTHIQDEHIDIAAKQLENIYKISTTSVSRGSIGGQIVKLS